MSHLHEDYEGDNHCENCGREIAIWDTYCERCEP